MHLDLVAVVVDDYDPAIAFFVDVLGFDLVEDSPPTRTTGARSGGSWCARPGRGPDPARPGRRRAPGRRGRASSSPAGSGLFLRVDDFDAAHPRMRAAGVEFVTRAPRRAVRKGGGVLDVAGNRWDLLGERAG